MPLSAGTRLGPYEILAPLGAGGMGEVYRARDTRLDRAVAIKVLPSEVSSDAARLSRFEKEARSASALNHPNIVTIYEIERSDSAYYIVMELVDGKTLREVFASGPVPLKKTLQITAQITEGLAKAHAASIVHRDLKPENVMLTSDGLVKVLDFGLAKLPPAAAEGASQMPTQEGAPTHPGVILGTVGYMSPEQARGAAVDYRSDQFALGSVLYEMLTGKRPFQRDSSAQTLAAIIEDEPEPISALNPKVPVPVRWIVERCLAKEPADRYASTLDLARDLANVRDHLSEASTSPSGLVAAPAVRPRTLALRPIVWGALGLAIGAAVVFFLLRSPTEEPPAVHTLTFSGHDSSPSVSPDGRTMAFVSDRDGVPRIWLKQFAGGGEVPLTSGPDSAPRFSPDGSMILFARREGSRTSLYRVPAVGGEPRKLIDDALEGDWSPDGRQIAFLRLKTERGATNSVLGVAAADGSGRRELRTLENEVAVAPRWSPDGQTIAFVVSAQFGLGGVTREPIRLVRLDGKEERRLLPPPGGSLVSSVAWSGSGDKLIYAQTESVAAATFMTSGPTRIVRQDISSGRARILFWIPAPSQIVDIAGPGHVVFDTFNSRENLREVPLGPRGRMPDQRWLTRGNSIDRQPIYSPEGDWLAFTSNRSGNLDLWEIGVKTGTIRRLTDDTADDWDPGFSPDGRKIIWSSNRSGHFEIWMAEADGSSAHQLTNDGFDAENPTMTRDGRWVVYNSGHPRTHGVWKIRSDGSEATQLAAGTTAWPEASPDGNYALYTLQRAEGNVVRVVRIADGIAVASEVLIRGVATGRARWLPDGHAIAFIDANEKGVRGVSVQDFAPGQDTSATRRPLAAFDPELNAESFAFSRDGSRMAVAVSETVQSIMTADGVPGVAPPVRHPR